MSLAPTQISPASKFNISESFFSPVRIVSYPFLTYSASSPPSFVKRTPLDVRTKRAQERSLSRCLTAWLTAGCEMESASAAREILLYLDT